MTTKTYSVEEVVFGGAFAGFRFAGLRWTPDPYDLRPSDLNATGTFEVSRAGLRKLKNLFRGRRTRASKGRRKHVRRMKAAGKRACAGQRGR